MTHREEMITRIRSEDDNLERQIETLQEEANHQSAGIRQYRYQRVDQLRNRQRDLRARVNQMESHPDDAWDSVKHEAEKLWFELKDIASVAARTFH
ncbi:hypothetical protein [Fimbriimonas ginsengisoli]|uniref:Uncharacterized protein n=1 Tax=Fimbriimonas ginsengisoli Gsoil 348 TaxID=661478 RepID=A0A068NYP0_FIMGI|nr:hypothetical protein [Fimbriimonas ginsengisoli]AIE87159.1 hypothetical protein OP10G_3791 [Fimbriimonas ginsengisoli Gsoil 348]